jgi:small conductance mechanosensitive channel
MVARTETLRGLFKNVIDFTLFMIAILIILSYWGINIIPILTGASILGLAVSFGAQTFIKDVIAGMFIILEDQFHIGDMVKVDKYEGEVVNISLRLTILRDSKGNYIYMPNSQITTLIRLKTTKKL